MRKLCRISTLICLAFGLCASYAHVAAKPREASPRPAACEAVLSSEGLLLGTGRFDDEIESLLKFYKDVTIGVNWNSRKMLLDKNEIQTHRVLPIVPMPTNERGTRFTVLLRGHGQANPSVKEGPKKKAISSIRSFRVEPYQIDGSNSYALVIDHIDDGGVTDVLSFFVALSAVPYVDFIFFRQYLNPNHEDEGDKKWRKQVAKTFKALKKSDGSNVDLILENVKPGLVKFLEQTGKPFTYLRAEVFGYREIGGEVINVRAKKAEDFSVTYQFMAPSDIPNQMKGIKHH